LSLSRRTIPYASVDGSRNEPFDEGLQLASLYILADSIRGTAPLSATAFLYYPIQIRRWDGGAVLIDMLGLNQTSFKLRRIPDVEGFGRELESASEEPVAFRKALKRRASHFSEFSDQQTIAIKGLLTKPRKIEEVQSLLERSVELDQRTGSLVFRPVMKGGEVTAIFDALNTLRGKIQNDVESLEAARQGLHDVLGIVDKVLNEEVQNIKDSSAKTEDRLSRDLRKKRDRVKKILDREIEKLREAYRKQAQPLRDERTKRKRRVTRLEKRIDRLRFTGAPGEVKAQRGTLDEMKAKYREMDSAVKALEAKLDGEIKKARDKSKKELKVAEDKIREAQKRAKAQIQKKLDVGSLIEAEAREITRQIDALIRKKRNDLRSVLRVKMDLDVEETELYFPFYVFQYGEKRFDFHPPAVVAGSRGLLSRFRRMLAESLESKVRMLIRPQGLFAEKYIAKAVKTLGGNTAHGKMYRKEAEGLDLFRRRDAMDMMMTGLVKMRREGWISDGEYIRLQEGLVDRLGTISQG
jgi:hypothetical protein